MSLSFACEVEKQAYLCALRTLEVVQRSENEIRARLNDKGFSEAVIDRTLERLKTYNVVNDHAYAQRILASAFHGKPRGKKRVSFELRQKRVKDDVIRDVLSAFDRKQEAELARELAREKAEQWQGLSREKRRKRIYDLLIRRGFEFDVVQDVVFGLDRQRHENE
jgi:regulatory protein